MQNSESVDDESLLEAESHVVFLNPPRSPSPAPEADSAALYQPPPPPSSSSVEDDAWMFAPLPSPPGDYEDRLFQEAMARVTPLEAGAWEAAPLFNHAVGGNATIITTTTATATAVYAEVSRELCPLVVENIMGALRHNANEALIREAVVAEINAFLQVLLDPALAGQ